ncbi:MBL fold metallo-hydrolase [Magnetospirillum sp. UT-4]|uniref:MBL fold metallo-hydrolase n=1 Tax=Magnetospirillum sp. UT-4 TaxID=2681467 RepID=UPI00137DAECE|nr:MBL fold metallo-hydrolase [Magnetospirillum sp. UT-4]CAA7617924.1 PhnP-like protein [Magnetospirillum sp. UT-4]
MRATILGSGAASGVPSISRGWGACDPAEPKNRRSRPSILVEDSGVRILVDTSPDCRQQLIDAGVRHLDAVLYTHDHADHLHGIDDLREVNRAMQAPIAIHGAPEVLDSIRARFPYVLGEVEGGQSIYKPMLLPHVIQGPFSVGGVGVVPIAQDHGYCATTGFRFGALAYSTDLVEMPEESFAALAGIEVWIVGCLTYDPHATHAHLDKVLGWIERIGPRRAVLTHMTPSLDYQTLRGRLPVNVEPGFDGMVIDVG